MLTEDLPGIGGRIKECPEDFVVEEIPAYTPSGVGEHVMIRVKKRDATTDQVARSIARALDVRTRDIGFAGRKDKQAVTTQWFSVHTTQEPAVLEELETEQFSVLEARRHGNKLRTGHLKGNRFTIVVRGVVDDALGLAQAILERIHMEGLPNAFGPQRFGRQGDNVRQAMGWILGDGHPPRDRRKRKMIVSSLQALLFNKLVERRIGQRAFTSAIHGDIIKIHATGGMFIASDTAEVTERVRSREVSPTGPIFGARMWWPEEEALNLELSVLAGAGLDREHLERFRRDGSGSRRPIRVFPEDVSLSREGDAMTLAFTLDAGAFATTLLYEITKSEELRPPTELGLEGSLQEKSHDHRDDGDGEHDSNDTLTS